MFLRRFAIVAPFSFLLSLSSNALADDHAVWSSLPPPKCSGTNKQNADKEKADGITHYRRAKAGGADGTSEFNAALASFDASCASGDDMALEFRAYALAGLERWVEAAETLDAFLSLHPLDGLKEDVRARVSSQREEIVKRVASLSVDSKPAMAKVVINHREMGMTPLADLRLPKGIYDIEVIPAEGTSLKRTVTIAPGPHSEVFDFNAETKPEENHDLKPVDLPPPPPPTDNSSFKTWGVVTGVAGGVLIATSIGMFVWLASNASKYNSDGCARTPQPASCADTKSSYNLSLGLALGTLIPGVILGITTPILFSMGGSKSSTPPAPGKGIYPVGMWCSPGLLSVGCGGSF
jgi:PEGA domain